VVVVMPVVVAPVVMMPVVPVVVMPMMPMAVVPVVMMPVMPVAMVPVVVVPADLFRLKTINLVLPHNRGLCACSARQYQTLSRRNRRQRRSVRGRSKSCDARGYPKDEIQKVSAYHNFFSFAHE
jgi:hypothetical protein